MKQHTTNNRIEEINKIYDYTRKLIEEENKDKEEVTKALMEMGVDEQRVSAIYLDVIYQANLAKVRNVARQDNKSGNGWLLSFFLIAIGTGSLITLVLRIKNFSLSDYEEWGNISKYIVAFGDLFFYVLVAVLGTYTIISFLKTKPNAVFLGKSYLIIIFVNNLISLLAGEYEGSYTGGVLQISWSLIYCGLWFSYLCLSKRVESLFPPEKRVVFKRDKQLIASIIVVVMSSFWFGFFNGLLEEYEAIKSDIYTTEFVLSENEYSDGRIAFTKPPLALKTGWNRIYIKDVGYFDLPPTMEVQKGKYKEFTDITRKIHGFDATPLTAQQKGLNELEKDGLERYARVMVESEIGRSGDYEKLNFNISEYTKADILELNTLFKHQIQQSISVFGIKLTEWHPLKVERINGMSCLHISYIRQLKQSPLVLVNMYHFYNNDRMHTLTLSYRLSESSYWQVDFAHILNSFRITNIR